MSTFQQNNSEFHARNRPRDHRYSRPFSTLNFEEQSIKIELFLARPCDQAFQSKNIGEYLKWIDQNIRKPKKIINKYARVLFDSTNLDSIAKNPSIGKALNVLFWNSNKRKLKKIVNSLLTKGTIEDLMKNPSLPELVNVASKLKLRSSLIRFGARLIESKDKINLFNNPSLRNFLLEMDQANVVGLAKNLDPSGENTYKIWDTKLQTNPRGSISTTLPVPRYLARNCPHEVRALDPFGMHPSCRLGIHREFFRMKLPPGTVS